MSDWLESPAEHRARLGLPATPPCEWCGEPSIRRFRRRPALCHRHYMQWQRARNHSASRRGKIRARKRAALMREQRG